MPVPAHPPPPHTPGSCGPSVLRYAGPCKHQPARSLRILLLTASLAGLLAASSAQAETSLADRTSDYMRDYLSDPRRVGSLAGSILGGALTAHPVGPVLGGLVGFFVGKQSMFQPDPAQGAENTVLAPNRDIIPSNPGTAVATLSFAGERGASFPAAQDLPSAVAPLATPQTSALSPAPGSPALAPAPALPRGFSREQVALLCSAWANMPPDPRLRSMCFYHQ